MMSNVKISINKVYLLAMIPILSAHNFARKIDGIQSLELAVDMVDYRREGCIAR